jgi:hypothetical protein
LHERIKIFYSKTPTHDDKVDDRVGVFKLNVMVSEKSNIKRGKIVYKS